MNSPISREGTVSAVQPVVRQFWRHPDGSGKLVKLVGPPEFGSEADRQAWDSDNAYNVRTEIRAGGGHTAYHQQRAQPTRTTDFVRNLYLRKDFLG